MVPATNVNVPLPVTLAPFPNAVDAPLPTYMVPTSASTVPRLKSLVAEFWLVFVP